MKDSLFAAVSLPLLLSTPLHALADSDITAPVIVTATRTPETSDATLASVTVITRADIERSQAQSVQDLLRGEPGIEIANNGGEGKATSVFLRGTNADHVLVLIDGVKVGSATLGTTPFQDIPIDQIQRIEIVRGPRSSLYGSEAIGGVIQIFTRKGSGPSKPHLSIGGGSYGTYDASTGVSGSTARGWYSVNAAHRATRGFNACNGQAGVGGCFTNEPDDDGYRNTSGSARAGYQFSSGAQVSINALRTQGHNEYDGSYVNQSNFLQQVLGGGLRFSPTGNWHVSARAGRSQDDSDNFLNGAFKTRFNTLRDTASLQNDISLGSNHLLTLGADYQNDQVSSTSAYSVDSRNNEGAFTEYQGYLGRQQLQASLRHDNNEQFGGHNTGALAWGYRFPNEMRLRASYGTAFKAPTFNELYFPSFGNPNLRPENSRSAELGVSGSHWSVSAYQTTIDDMIAFDSSTSAPANIRSARIRGAEVTTSIKLSGWRLQGALTLLDPENRSAGSNQGNTLPRRARRQARIDADRAFGRYRFGATILAVGKRYDDLANTRTLAGYTTVDLRAEYRFDKAWRLQARIENLLDKDYETAAFYNQPGRSVYVTLRYEP